MTRAPRLLSLAAIAVLAIAACGGSAASTSPSEAPAASAPTLASEAPASVAPPSEAPASAAAEGPDIGAAADAIDNVQRYAISLKVAGLEETAADAEEITMDGLVDRENNAYHFDMTGVAGLEALGGDSGISFVVIGNDAWISTDGTNFIQTPGGAAMFGPLQEGLAPAALLGAVPPSALENLPAVGQEEKNGVATTHYHLTGADSPDVARDLGTDAVVDMWIADEGGYLISMLIDGVTDVNGTATPINIQMDFSRINDETIAIEPPN